MKKRILLLSLVLLLLSLGACSKEAENQRYDENDKTTWWMEDYDPSVYE